MLNLDGGPNSEDFATLFGEPVIEPAGGEPPAVEPSQEVPAEPEAPAAKPEPSGEEPPAAEPEPAAGRDASRLQSELDTLKERTKDYDNLQQLLNIVTSNPALNEAVRLAVAGLDPTQAFAKAAQPAKAEPVKGWQSSIPDPVKPADFDEFQSVSDPASASYRYRVAVDEKRIQDAIDKRVFDIEARRTQEIEKATQESQRQQARAQALAVLDQAIIADGLADKADAVRAWVLNGIASATPQQVLKMFRAVHGLDAQPAAPVVPGVDKKKTELAAQRKAAEDAVAAGATIPGAPVPTEDDKFFAGHGTAMAGLYS